MRRVVVLPAPLGPRKPWTSPVPTTRLRWSSARTAPKDLTRSAPSIAVDIFRSVHYLHNIVKTINADSRLKSRVQFVERFASALNESGFARMPARVFAALMATDSGALTAAELATLLRVSPAAISGAVRYLIQVNLASREPEPGSRRERYHVHNEVWHEAVAGKDRRLERCEQSLRRGLEVVGRDSPAGQRIAETIAFFEFLQTELPLLMKEWQQRRATVRFAVKARGARNVGRVSPRASERAARAGQRRSLREKIE